MSVEQESEPGSGNGQANAVDTDFTIDLGGGCYVVGKDTGDGNIHPVMVERDVKPGWRTNKGTHWDIQLAVESGAVTSVVPKNLIPGASYRENEKSRAGLHYRVANGGRIPNRGEVVIEGKVGSNQPIKLIGQVTDVEKPLMSTKEIVLAGNRVVHELNNDYIENLRSGKRVPIQNVGGEYTITVSVKKPDPRKGFVGLVRRWI